MISESELFDRLLRERFPSFIEKVFRTTCPGRQFQTNWHIKLIADRTERCRQGQIQRLIVNLPPRSLKSIVLSVALPAFVLGHDPTQRIICVSYAQDLAEDHARLFRFVVRSEWYRHLFPRMRLSTTKDTAAESITTAGGFRLATSVGGTLTGRGGDLIIIDDPLKPSEALSDSTRDAVNQWFDLTCSSRLDDKAKGVIIVVMQRLHVADLTGYLLAKGDHWRHLSLPAIAVSDESFKLRCGQRLGRSAGEVLHKDREPLGELHKIRKDLGSHIFSAQYQQAPVPLEGGMVKLSWFNRYDVDPGRQPSDLLVHSWDTASKKGKYNDFSVCTVWLVRGNYYFLRAVHRRRVDYPELKKWARELARLDQPDCILIEDHSSGTQLIQELRAESGLQPSAIMPTADKLTRAVVQSAKIEAGSVQIPSQAPWLEAFLLEVAAFPDGRFDDQIDSMTQFLEWVSSRPMPDAPFVIVESRAAAEWDAEFRYR